MKGIAFDLGNVLIKVDFKKYITEWHRQKLYKREDVWHFLNSIQAGQDLGLTTMSDSLELRHGVSGKKLRLLHEAWRDSLIKNEQMFSFVEDLKKEREVALLSNIGSEHALVVREKYGELFDRAHLHLSYEVGARKPTKLYFQSFLLQHSNFHGGVFVDDRDENLLMGRELGFKDYKFDLHAIKDLSNELKMLYNIMNAI
ncbi:MAG: hypothetical protein Q8O87_04155 [bacterium]|nr:hypothetical protein [bacterium]